MPSYRVVWEVDVEAENATEAALEARRMQRGTSTLGWSTATVFDVYSFDGEHAGTVDVSRGRLPKDPIAHEREALAKWRGNL